MSEPPPIPPMAPLPRDQRNIDEDHLNLLSVFHFVGAGLSLVGIPFLFLHYAFLHFMFTSTPFWTNQKGEPPPAAIFRMFIIFYIIVGTWLLASAILNTISGLFLHRRKNRTFSLVVAGIDCLHFPFGTVLGVFTIIVLCRESVRQLYEGVRQGTLPQRF
jgi:ABC-type phosphate transport system permease subunit